MSVLRHQHLRKRGLYKATEAVVSPGRVSFLDRLTVLVGVVGPLTTLPQIIQIFSTHDATGVSGLSWSMFALFDIPFIFYGLVHKDKVIITTYLCWFVANFTVVLGAVLY